MNHPLKKFLIKSTSLYDLFDEQHIFSGEVIGLSEKTDEELIDYINKNKNNIVNMRCAYNKAGIYIGNEEVAKRICDDKGISPEAIGDNKVCSIGKSIDGKWYGWSHRAIYGFAVGSTCKKGDCHYVPKDEQDAIEDGIRFWSDTDHLNVKAGEITELGEMRGVYISWIYSKNIPNEKLHETISSVFHHFPDTYGKGEWTAETEKDAKQMAIDFANGVS